MTEHIETMQLANFLSVAEAGSFRGAAHALSVGQSAVSRRVQRLEDLLGVSLFERRSTGARLTPAGTCLASRARAILDDLDTASEVVKAGGKAENGYLRIGMIASLSRGAFRSVIARFRAEHPGVDLCLIEADRSELLTLLSHRRLDTMFAAGEAAADADGEFLFTREPTYLAVPADGGYSEYERLTWSDVSDNVFIVSSREPGPEIHDFIRRKLSDFGRAVVVRRYRFGREGIMALVGLGFGVSLVADHWRGATYPNVRFIRIGAADGYVPFTLTWRPENDNPALRRFISLARIEAKRNGALSAPSRTHDPSS